MNTQFQPGAPVPQPQKTNGLAIAGFVTSFFCSLIGLVLSAVALSQINKTGQGGKGLAVAGIVIGAVGFLFTILFWGAIGAAISGSTY